MNRLKIPLSLAIILAVSAACVSASECFGFSDTSDTQIENLIEKLDGILPADWRIVETGLGEMPIGWTGTRGGLYAMVEDTQTRFFHPSGFHYYSFYRVWIMPPDWEGEMNETPYVSDSSPAYLLGVSDGCVAFYHTAGGNIWKQGPARLCSALELSSIRYSDLARRIVDLEIEEKLKTRLDELVPAAVIVPQRIVGLAGGGPSLYLEYVFGASEDDSQDDPLAEMTEELVGNVFTSLPEIESVYLRRCTADTYTDTIVHRN